MSLTQLPNNQSKLSGVVLAGGQGQRMQAQDKGLLLFNRQPLVSYALAALSPIVDELMISANRNQTLYAQFGYPVVSDQLQDFAGPLAGILAAMQHANYPILLVTPCDTPLLTSAHLQRLVAALAQDVDVSVAWDGERLHPVVMAVKTDLQASLQHYLSAGERKIQLWLHQQRMVKVDFRDATDVFTNLNTPGELAALEGMLRNH